MKNGFIYIATGQSVLDTLEMNTAENPLKVTIIGAGLVGSLCACFMARRGFEVHLYETKADIRKTKNINGRSINLALSARGRSALRALDLEVQFLQVPMRGRMIHYQNGTQQTLLYDSINNECIYSVNRNYLNAVLLTAAERYKNLQIHFQHKCLNAHLKEGQVTFLQMETNKCVDVSSNLIIGCDGAYSVVRRSMLKEPFFNFRQTYMNDCYLELQIPANKIERKKMEENFLHIWPRNEFMIVALPNNDHSFTVTLFMPFQKFQALNTPESILTFFSKYFPDTISLIGEERLIHDLIHTKPSTLISIKCNPYHFDNKALIIGDAAHAMLPFFGQGMNAGFQDCLILDQLFDQFPGDLDAILSQFTNKTCANMQIINDLSFSNCVEMRDLLNKRSFHLRKKLDEILFYLFPFKWIPLYNLISFTEIGYKKCLENYQRQNQIILHSFYLFITTIIIIFVGILVVQFIN